MFRFSTRPILTINSLQPIIVHQRRGFFGTPVEAKLKELINQTGNQIKATVYPKIQQAVTHFEARLAPVLAEVTSAAQSHLRDSNAVKGLLVSAARYNHVDTLNNLLELSICTKEAVGEALLEASHNMQLEAAKRLLASPLCTQTVIDEALRETLKANPIDASIDSLNQINSIRKDLSILLGLPNNIFTDLSYILDNYKQLQFIENRHLSMCEILLHRCTEEAALKTLSKAIEEKDLNIILILLQRSPPKLSARLSEEIKHIMREKAEEVVLQKAQKWGGILSNIFTRKE